MKRLMIAAVLMLATSSLSVWAQTPAADADKPQAAKPAQTMPMANCPHNDGTTADAQKGCPIIQGQKSDQGAVPMHQMMHDGMMRGQQHPDGQGSMGCCELSKADDKPK